MILGEETDSSTPLRSAQNDKGADNMVYSAIWLYINSELLYWEESS